MLSDLLKESIPVIVILNYLSSQFEYHFTNISVKTSVDLTKVNKEFKKKIYYFTLIFFLEEFPYCPNYSLISPPD